MAIYYKVDKQPTIYEETEEKTLSPFIGEKSFLESGGQFGMEQTISPEQFSQYKLGTPIGAEFLKTETSPTVYQAGTEGIRPIKSEAAFESLTGDKDFSQVATVSPELLAGYKMGDIIDIPSAQTIVAGKEFGEVAKQVGAEEKETERAGLFGKIAEAIRGKPEAIKEARIGAAEEYGLTEKEAKVTGILESAAKIEAQFTKQIETNRAKPLSANLIRGREGLIRRQMAIELSSLAAFADIAQGNVATAQSKITQTVNEAIAVEQANLDALQVELQVTELSPIDKMRLDFMFSERTRNLEREETLIDQKTQLQLTLLQNGIQASSNETFDQLTQKLSKIFSNEELSSFYTTMGMVYNPLKKEWVPIPKEEAVTTYKPPTSYQEWTLAGKPGTFEDWVKEAPKVEERTKFIGTSFYGMSNSQITDVHTEEKAPDWFRPEGIVNESALQESWKRLQEEMKGIGAKIDIGDILWGTTE